MSVFDNFVVVVKDYANREDWPEWFVPWCIGLAEQKFNAELRIGDMIKSADALIASRCAPLPDDWLEMSLVRIACDNVPDGFLPIRYKARDEFFQTPDKWVVNFYTIEGRQIYIGGAPDSVNGKTVRMSYYATVPTFFVVLEDSWLYDKYPSLYLSATMMQAYMHAVGEEQLAALAKQLTEDTIQKLNDEWRLAKASGSRLTRTRTRSFG